MNIEQIKLFLVKQKIPFQNLELYRYAFTHTSYVHETIKSESKIIHSYERMEFLGDAVLGKIIAEFLFKEYNYLEPGDLSLMRSKIVCKESLSKIGKNLNLNKLIFFGKGEMNKIPSDSVFEDVVESFIAAIYLDLGEAFTQKYVLTLFKPYIIDIDTAELKDYKTKLQELLQSEKRKSVTYKTIRELKQKNGTIEFHVKVYFDQTVLGFGKGESKKKAQQMAARDAYEKMVGND